MNEVCRAQIQRSKTKFILNSLTDILENSSELPNSLKEKCNNRLEFCNLMKTLKYNTEIMKKFDIQDIGDSFVLTDGERRLIQSTIRKEIDTKCSEIKQENEIILGTCNFFCKIVQYYFLYLFGWINFIIGLC